MSSEFELIRKYFTRQTKRARLGIGDDCALVQLGSDMALALSTDMLVSGVHFFPDVDPFQLGHKVLAVNLSDIAAMGANPRWCTLAIALPEADEAWIKAFSRGFFSVADRYEVELIGGDTTRGPLNLCVQIMGEAPVGTEITRSGAKVGDDIWISGELGDAALGLAHLKGKLKLDREAADICLPRLYTPTPRVELGCCLRGLAHSCIDISDGLLGDLGHILERSTVGAELWLDQLPRSVAIDNCPDKPLAETCMLAGGDDYELCFTVRSNARGVVEMLARQVGIRLTRVGRINEVTGLSVLDVNRNPIDISVTGFDHFKR